jgi:hypothetical protein
MGDITIRCIITNEKIKSSSSVGVDYKSITAVRTVHNNEFSRESIIRLIEKGTSAFYVDEGEDRVEVVVVTLESGEKYIRTKKDDKITNNLENLPECG